MNLLTLLGAVAVFGPSATVVLILLLRAVLGMFIMVVLVIVGRLHSILLILCGHMPQLLWTTTLPVWLITKQQLLLLWAVRLLAWN